MKILFNPSININSLKRNNNTFFKGSFNMPLDAFIPQDPKEKEEVQPSKTNIITRTFKIDSKKQNPTFVRMWSMSEEEAKTNIPSVVVDALKGTNADIYNDIYMAGGIADNNRYFVVFNSYYLDKETNKNNVQYFCLVSKDNKPTDLQKAVIKFFNGTSAKNLLKKGSSDNPFEKMSDNNEPNSKLFEIYTYGLAAISNESQIDDIDTQKPVLSPVIYSGDGRYTKYKMMRIDLSNL